MARRLEEMELQGERRQEQEQEKGDRSRRNTVDRAARNDGTELQGERRQETRPGLRGGERHRSSTLDEARRSLPLRTDVGRRRNM